jgi:Reverse transcriptase (RNA-dependent DNA polymerase).
MCPINKKGDKLKCKNYRGITLLNTAHKIFSGILLRQLSKYTNKIIGNYQAGFRKDRLTNDQIHALRQMLEKTLE